MKATLMHLSILAILSVGCSGEISREDTTIQREEEIRREDIPRHDQDVPYEEGVQEMEYERDVLNQ